LGDFLMGFPQKKIWKFLDPLTFFWMASSHPKAFDRHQVTVLPGRVSGAWTFGTDQSKARHGDDWVTPWHTKQPVGGSGWKLYLMWYLMVIVGD
jgi:hypothetical protein